MSIPLQPKTQVSGTGHLLIIQCSKTKIEEPVFGEAPAFEIYNGPYYKSLRKFLRENGWPPGLMVKIISAKHIIIDATELIRIYDKRMDKEQAEEINSEVLEYLKGFGAPASVFINLGKDYMPAVDNIDALFPSAKITHANGGIGQKTKEMKQWLHDLPNCLVSINSDKRSPLYFFPDWNEYVYEPFELDDADKVKAYAHEVFSEEVPYDGLLFSLAQLKLKQNPLTNNTKDLSFTISEQKKKKIS